MKTKRRMIKCVERCTKVKRYKMARGYGTQNATKIVRVLSPHGVAAELQALCCCDAVLRVVSSNTGWWRRNAALENNYLVNVGREA